MRIRSSEQIRRFPCYRRIFPLPFDKPCLESRIRGVTRNGTIAEDFTERGRKVTIHIRHELPAPLDRTGHCERDTVRGKYQGHLHKFSDRAVHTVWARPPMISIPS